MSIPLVFFGSPQFAVPSLVALSQDTRFRVALVVTQPDRPSGRGRHTVAPPVKLTAQELSHAVWQPETLRDPVAVARLRAVDAQVFVVAAYGEIFRRAVLELPPHGCLNIHPSLLPRYRGSSPIQAAILNGDNETGVSIIQLVRQLDAGPLVAQSPVTLSGHETAGALSARLAEVAAELLPGSVAGWVAGAIPAVPQDEEAASYTRELRKDDGRVDWHQSATSIERLVRAMNPWPRAWGIIDGKRVSLLQVAPIDRVDTKPSPGVVERAPQGVIVSTGDGAIRLLSVQPEGRKEMPAEDWLRGARLPDDAYFELGDVESSQNG